MCDCTRKQNLIKSSVKHEILLIISHHFNVEPPYNHFFYLSLSQLTRHYDNKIITDHITNICKTVKLIK